MLHRPRHGDPAAGAGVADEDTVSERQAEQAALEDRIRGMLERLVGPGHADVRVSVEIDSARVEHVEDHYDPAKAILRSSDETIERVAQEGTVTGVPGAESNTPLASGGSGQGAGTNIVRESRTHNFEIDHVSDKRIQSPGSLKRMTVAVVLDGVPGPGGAIVARARDELDRMTALVTSAAGADPKRGDVVTVDSIPFVTNAIDMPPAPAAPPSTFERLKKKPVVAYGAIAGAAIVAIIFLATRRRRRSVDSSVEKRAVLPPATTQTPLVEGTNTSNPSNAIDWRSDAIALAARDPATAALVVRAWLGASESGTTLAERSS
jgi:flagellar M-ring protein FliF